MHFALYFILIHVFGILWVSSEVAQLCPTPCDHMDCSLPGYSVCGILQARILEWDAISFCRRSFAFPNSGEQDPQLIIQPLLTSESACFCALLLQLCLTLCNPKDCKPPGSSVHGVLQARILGWVSMPFSRGSSQLRDQIHIPCISSIIGAFFFAHWATWELL